MASQDAVSGPQANVTVWEGSLLESQVAELPTTKPYRRTERAHEGGVQDMLGLPAARPTGCPLSRDKGLQHTQFATARRTEPDVASSSEWLLTETLPWGTVTSSLSYLPTWTPRSEPLTWEMLVWLLLTQRLFSFC